MVLTAYRTKIVFWVVCVARDQIHKQRGVKIMRQFQTSTQISIRQSSSYSYPGKTWNLKLFFLATSSSCCQHQEQQLASTYILQLLEFFKEFSVCRLSVFYSLQHLMNTFPLICIALNKNNWLVLRKALPNRKEKPVRRKIDWLKTTTAWVWKTPKFVWYHGSCVSESYI